MHTKTVTAVAALALAQLVAGADYWKNFNSSVDPSNINIPQITQTTSIDPTQECVNYQPQGLDIVASEFPTPWETATSNGMNTSQEFQNLYNSISWSSAPNIPVRTVGADGALNMTGYDQQSDPDCWWSASTCTKPKHQDVNEDIYACPEPETWGLTYDDGPNCSHNAFYDFLEQQKLKATMFYIGSNVIDWPYGAQRGIKDGHQIADHTWSHQLMTTLTNEEVLAELYYTQKAIKLVTGVTPKFWRPAFGDVDDRVRWIATQLNLTTILWNLDTDDWAAGNSVPVETVQNTYNDFIEMGKNGTFATSGNIVLTHEIDNTTMQLAYENLPKIQEAYKNVIDIATCMNITHPYMEENISWPAFGQTNSSAANGTSAAGDASSPNNAQGGGSGGSSAASTAVGSKAGAFLAIAGAAIALLA